MYEIKKAKLIICDSLIKSYDTLVSYKEEQLSICDSMYVKSAEKVWQLDNELVNEKRKVRIFKNILTISLILNLIGVAMLF